LKGAGGVRYASGTLGAGDGSLPPLAAGRAVPLLAAATLAAGAVTAGADVAAGGATVGTVVG
jgi:hypothetical protein